ncbi:MAG: CHAT domain-containing protein, partial [Cyanobacteria bacterium J06626_23]
PDDATGELMVSFYQQLEQGQSEARALRQAMLSTREAYPHPYAWAAFTLIGNAR